MFIRPLLDDKSFSGQVMTWKEFSDWWTKLVKMQETGDYTTLPLNTQIVLSKLKPIEKEYRFIIVDGKVITGSLYKLGDNVLHSREIDLNVETFAMSCVAPMSLSSWNPARAFALDVAVSDGKPYVLEIGGINSVGLYACDTQKIIGAIEEMRF